MGFFSNIIADSQRSLGGDVRSNSPLVDIVPTSSAPFFAEKETRRKGAGNKQAVSHKADATVDSAEKDNRTLNDEISRTDSRSLPVSEVVEERVDLAGETTEVTRRVVKSTTMDAKVNASRIEKVAVVNQIDGDIQPSNHAAPDTARDVALPSPLIQSAETASVDQHVAASVNTPSTASVTTDVERLAPANGQQSENWPVMEQTSDLDDSHPEQFETRSDAVDARHVQARADIGLPLSAPASAPGAALKNSVAEPRTTTNQPQVRIGQVNVTVEKRGVPKAQTCVAGSHRDMASRNFLKGL